MQGSDSKLGSRVIGHKAKAKNTIKKQKSLNTGTQPQGLGCLSSRSLRTMQKAYSTSELLAEEG